MDKTQIDALLLEGEFPEATKERKLLETHISWIILCDDFVYKIKKPITYSFLDFSTIELRKHFCERELKLNQRFSENIYLEVVPIYKTENQFVMGREDGTLVDHALKMRKLQPEKRMDLLVAQNKVSEGDIKNLAERIVDFHKSAPIIYKKNVLKIKEDFNDLELTREFISGHLGPEYGMDIDRAIKTSDTFLKENENLLNKRLQSGFIRDVHGDLHTRNIFLLPEPQPFDCIEFNEDYRQIDLLNEVAFLCMDLDALDRADLSDLFIGHYDQLLPTIQMEGERELFIYFKAYRANVRAKVNSLRAKSASGSADRDKALSESKKYLLLMGSYLKLLNVS